MLVHTLTPAAWQLFQRLGQEPWLHEFYLAGGSAAALHLGHRVSVDMDFFTPQEYDPELLSCQLQRVGHLRVQQQSQGTLVGQVSGVQVSYFTYPYPLLEETIALAKVQVASLLDIALMKLIAIGQRGTKRDFVDLYFICQSGWQLADLLQRVPQKYRTVSYPSYHLLRALVYFEDAESDVSPQMLVEWDWAAVKEFFEGEVRALVDRL
jgi:hypothetical protein